MELGIAIKVLEQIKTSIDELLGDARYFRPSVDEWYMAAYFDPQANDGAGGYWDFPSGSDSAPIAVAP